MTILFAGTERESLSGFGVSLSEAASVYRAAYGRGSSQEGSAGYYEVLLDDEQTELWVHAFLGNAGFGDDPGPQIAFMDAADNTIVRLLGTNPNFSVQYWNGAAFVTLGTVNKNFAAGLWDMHVKKAGAASIVAGYYNNNIVGAEGNPVNLAAFGNIKKVRFYRAGYGVSCLSEVVITNSEPTLGWDVFTAPPTANGTDTDGTGVVGDVNELDMNTGTYITLDNAGDKISFVHTPLTAENFIRGVAAACCARRVDETGPQKIRPYLIISGVRYYGPASTLTVDFKNYEHVWTDSPASGTDWTTAEVNAAGLEMGWEAVT